MPGLVAEAAGGDGVEARRVSASEAPPRVVSSVGPVGAMIHQGQTLKRNNSTSPSFTTYSFPSLLTSPCRKRFQPLAETKSSNATVSARMNPFPKSEWITPAAAGALSPSWIVQAHFLFAGREVAAQAEQIDTPRAQADRGPIRSVRAIRGTPCAPRPAARPARLRPWRRTRRPRRARRST